ncbi:Uncharacterized membrane protein [Pelagirhabdus alkalitolerans]|uniref:Uncharacterized membrane protein n=1 Tax=Pelagirhabdus alkalitolerans TaxID=1612202 RepID=A0A1G6M2X4_9BACI|nr:DUF2177 family protein [Pelagirhabdus alkalitolerans]SDC49863.1 Uncharacterized membrane protein [Pelagirhabdus alkalitolerans]
MDFLIAYLVTFVVFFVIDIIWLGLVARTFYKEQIGFLMKAKTNWTAAVIFYFIFIFGLVYFVIDPALQMESMSDALIRGLIFGLIAYSTYDLTNLATLDKWPLKVTIVDLIWGTTLGGLVSVVSYYITALI